MGKYLKRYIDIINMYQRGEFGEKHLALDEILSEAGEPDLLSNLSVNEIQYLENNSFGMTKRMYCIIKQQKIEKTKKMQTLENELKTYRLNEYCADGDISDKSLADKLKLEVYYCEPKEMPKDVEATLSSPIHEGYFGFIKILKNAVYGFSYMHEIIHYFRDVGIGHTVATTYTRKMQGKTDSPVEQEINYLAAAAIMPYESIAELIGTFESMDTDDEKLFLDEISKKYSQSYEAVARRFIEVRSLMNCDCCASQ